MRIFITSFVDTHTLTGGGDSVEKDSFLDKQSDIIVVDDTDNRHVLLAAHYVSHFPHKDVFYKLLGALLPPLICRDLKVS